MSFQEAMNTMLPPVVSNGTTIAPHKTSEYGEWREQTQRSHNAVDFNYTGGQASAHNKNNPSVYSPIAGTVVFSGGDYGTVKIKDQNGNIHKLLHFHSRSVAVDQEIKVGDELGAMGGRGPKGASEYSQHIHYAIEDKNGNSVNPEEFWKTQQITIPATAPTPPDVKNLTPFSSIKDKQSYLTPEAWERLGFTPNEKKPQWFSVRGPQGQVLPVQLLPAHSVQATNRADTRKPEEVAKAEYERMTKEEKENQKSDPAYSTPVPNLKPKQKEIGAEQ